MDNKENIISRDIMSKEEFDKIMQIGLEQAKNGDVIDIETAFSQLKTKL